MSQEKVNQYKESRKNRKAEIAKSKRKGFAAKLAAVLVLVAVCGWLGYSAVITALDIEPNEVAVDTTAINEYVTSLTEVEAE